MLTGHRAVERLAHGLKTSLGILGAQRAGTMAERLESAGRGGTLELAAGDLADLEAEVARVTAELTRLLEEAA